MKKKHSERQRTPPKIETGVPKTAEFLIAKESARKYCLSNKILAEELKTRGYSFELYADIASRLW